MIAILPIIATISLGVYYGVKYHERLHSEEFQLQLNTLNVIMQKGKGKIALTENIISIATNNRYRQDKFIDKKEED